MLEICSPPDVKGPSVVVVTGCSADALEQQQRWGQPAIPGDCFEPGVGRSWGGSGNPSMLFPPIPPPPPPNQRHKFHARTHARTHALLCALCSDLAHSCLRAHRMKQVVGGFADEVANLQVRGGPLGSAHLLQPASASTEGEREREGEREGEGESEGEREGGRVRGRGREGGREREREGRERERACGATHPETHRSSRTSPRSAVTVKRTPISSGEERHRRSPVTLPPNPRARTHTCTHARATHTRALTRLPCPAGSRSQSCLGVVCDQASTRSKRSTNRSWNSRARSWRCASASGTSASASALPLHLFGDPAARSAPPQILCLPEENVPMSTATRVRLLLNSGQFSLPNPCVFTAFQCLFLYI